MILKKQISKINDVCEQRGLILLESIDDKPNVFLCTDYSQKYVIKIGDSRIERKYYELFRLEYEKQLKNKKISVLKIPALLDFSDEWIIFEYIDGYNLRLEKEVLGINIVDSKYFSNIAKLFWEVKRVLLDIKNLPYESNNEETLLGWYEEMVLRWYLPIKKNLGIEIIDERIFYESISVVKEWATSNSDHINLEATFGVFGQYQIIAPQKDSSLYLTDFGDHIRMRLAYHDLAWLFKWDILRFSEREFLNIDIGILYIEKIRSGFCKFMPEDMFVQRFVYDAQFYINILEILVRCKENIYYKSRNHLGKKSDEYISILSSYIDNLFIIVLNKLRQLT